ncbi:hypothetical protein AND4_04353 [Vibrio sp. AND4]|nr:hypothetical protein AND4_04353 [Vibrio sp. AND4]
MKYENTLEGFPSGQREQTVNLPALPSMVRIRPPPPYSSCVSPLNIRIAWKSGWETHF